MMKKARTNDWTRCGLVCLGLVGLCLANSKVVRSSVPANDKCCRPSYLDFDEGSGYCICDFSWFNECESDAQNPCDADDVYPTWVDGTCENQTGTYCDENGPVNNRSVYSGSRYCDTTNWITTCSNNAECQCAFDYYWLYETSQQSVRECQGATCNAGTGG